MLVLGLYQAYCGCIAFIGAVYLVYIIFVCDETIYLKKYIFVSAITAVCGAIIYELVLHEELFRYNVELSSYNGANSLSLENIFDNIIPSLLRTYKIAWEYIMGIGYKWNLNNSGLILISLFFILGVSIIYAFVIHRNFIRLFVASIVILLLPVFANIVVILIPNSAYHEQQTAPLALVFPVAICLCIGVINQDNK